MKFTLNLNKVMHREISGAQFFFIIVAIAVCEVFLNSLRGVVSQNSVGVFIVANMQITVWLFSWLAVYWREKDMGGGLMHPRFVAFVTGHVLFVIAAVFQAIDPVRFGGNASVLQPVAFLVVLYITLCYMLVTREEAREISDEDRMSMSSD